MKKNHGFTLVELLAVIGILGVLIMVTIPTVNTLIKNNKEKLYKAQIENIEVGAREWGASNMQLLPEFGETIIVTLGDLKQGGFAAMNIKNPKTERPFPDDMIIYVRNKRGDYVYEVNEGGTPPILFHVAGGNEQQIEVNTEFVFPVVTATNPNGTVLEVTGPIVRKEKELVDMVMTNKIGDVYTLTYQATDPNSSITMTRIITLTIVDTIGPIITVNNQTGNHTVTIEATPTYVIPTATATDNSGEEIKVIATGDVTSSVEGTYEVIYAAIDSSNNKTLLTVTTIVKDTISPILDSVILYRKDKIGDIYEGEVWTNDNIVAIASVNDYGTGISKLEYSNDKKTWVSNWNKPYNHTTHTAELIIDKDWNNPLYVRAVDYAGNASETIETKLIRVDKTPPTIPTSIVRYDSETGEERANNEMNFTRRNLWWGSFDSKEEGSGFARYEYSMNCDGTVTGIPEESYFYDSNQDIKICLRAVDNVGNISMWSSPTLIKIDKTIIENPEKPENPNFVEITLNFFQRLGISGTALMIFLIVLVIVLVLFVIRKIRQYRG